MSRLRVFTALTALLGAAMLLAPTTAAASASGTAVSPFHVLPGQRETGYLLGATAAGPKSIFAGGYVYDKYGLTTVRFQHWNGSTVSAMLPGNVKSDAFGLDTTDMTALGPTDVWTVGDYCDYHNCTGLIAHWDGAKWRNINPPNAIYSSFDGYTSEGISAVGKVIYVAGSGMAIDYSGEVNSTASLMLRRDANGHWATTQLPGVLDGADTALTGVYAASSTDVWAVGYYGDPFGGYSTQNLVYHYDGTAWRILMLPASGNTGGVTSIRPGGPGELWLTLCAGDSTYSCGTPSNRLLHYSAGAWTFVAAPAGWQINAVRSGGASDLWAVGSAGGKALAAHWQGHSWQQIPVQPPGAVNSVLYAVVLTAKQVIAVGHQQLTGPNPSRTLWVARSR